MPFLALNNANFEFGFKKLTWRSYTIAKALSTTSSVEFIDKRKFIKIALDKNSKTFVIYVATLEVSTMMLIHLSKSW